MEKELSVEYIMKTYTIRIKYDGEVIKEIIYKNPNEWVSTINLLVGKNTKEIYDWAKGYCVFTN